MRSAYCIVLLGVEAGPLGSVELTNKVETVEEPASLRGTLQAVPVRFAHTLLACVCQPSV
jgi:hypothetical protein